jgi:protoporphyrinogen oxidase
LTDTCDVHDNLVIGAGPAGLTCGLTLAKHGKSVTVLEEDPVHVGGISRTVNYKGFLFDIGGHRFFSKSQEITRIWQELLPDDFLERPRLSRIYYGGKFYDYPLDAVQAFRNLGPAESVLCLASFFHAKLFPIASPKSFHDWVRNAFGERLFSIFFKTYTEKVWGMGCDEISADWAAQRIKDLNLWAAATDGLRRSLGLRRGKGSGTAKSLISSFQYPRRGPGMMWDAAAAALTQAGGRLFKGHKVVGLSRDDAEGLWRVKSQTHDGQMRDLLARNVVSSMAIRDLSGVLTPPLACAVEAGALRYRDFLTVVLIGRNRLELPDNWVYIHDPSVRVGRIQNFRSWSPEMIPDGTSTCLGLEYFCFENDALWTMTDTELIELAKLEIGRIGLMNPADVSDGCVVRQAKAYPVYDDTYRQRVAAVRNELAERFPTLHLIGRNGMHKYNNQDHAMMTGLLTALNIVAGDTLHDVWSVNEDAEYTEQGVSGADKALKSERLVPRPIASS